jgi:hypothetical protein
MTLHTPSRSHPRQDRLSGVSLAGIRRPRSAPQDFLGSALFATEDRLIFRSFEAIPVGEPVQLQFELVEEQVAIQGWVEELHREPTGICRVTVRYEPPTGGARLRWRLFLHSRVI